MENPSLYIKLNKVNFQRPFPALIVKAVAVDPYGKTAFAHTPHTRVDLPGLHRDRGLGTKVHKLHPPTEGSPNVKTPGHKMAMVRATRDYHNHSYMFHNAEAKDPQNSDIARQRHQLFADKHEEHLKIAEKHLQHFQNV